LETDESSMLTTTGRNDPCPCGSGKKYKKCCLTNVAQNEAGENPVPHQELFLLGRQAYRSGRHGEAATLIQRAIRAAPGNPDYYNALGVVSQALKKPDEAVSCFRKAIALDPDFAEAHSSLGDALKEQGKLEEAQACQQKASRLKRADDCYNSGNGLREQGRLDAAAERYREALVANPRHAMAYNNLGATLRDLGRDGEAALCYQNALALKPDYAEAHNNLGVTLHSLGKHAEAAACCRKALALDPGFAEAHFNLGNALRELRKPDEAMKSYRSAIALWPGYAEAHHNLGYALKELGRTDEAITSFRHAIALRPHFSEAHSSLLFLHAYQAFLEPGSYLALARGWEHACIPSEERQLARSRAFFRAPAAGRRLKVGYVSGDYWNHAVSYFVEQLFAAHDRTRIELFAYSSHGQQDAATARIAALAEHWAPAAGLSDAALLERLGNDALDVLIDLSGHTAHNRLGVFARRAAPVQAHYLGFFASTGLTEMDYFIGDAILTPPETDGHFSEEVWRLPRVWVSYDGKADAPLPGWRPAADGTVWLGSFNNLGKLTPETLALWARVLHALPQAQLLLKTRELADAGNRRRIWEAMAAHGIPEGRIELLDAHATPGWAEHMACYDRLDIALDPVGGVGGGTTTCDALWMGVPVITLEGGRMASRMTASMLDAIGHPEWVARSEEEYVAKAAALAGDVEQRKALLPTQRERMAQSPLCDARGLAQSLESAYFEMFERWQTGQKSPFSP
jgi:predicted O-linked N-acetylglucosamine transferase (SPINDLY family)